MLSSSDTQTLRRNLLDWFEVHKRDLAWRRTRDPYAIWISEVMLQQTRVAAVTPFYDRFLSKFPTVKHLAEASESELLACWAGLGYYYRARNLQRAAQQICASSGFPTAYEEIRVLPGVGDYTAAAVASICFDLPHAVLDGNVFRVLSRLLNDPTNIASSQGRRHFAKVADELLDRRNPGQFNQAMMELGATICLPKNPQCLLCPVRGVCSATQYGTQNSLPVKIVARRNVEETRTLLWIERDDAVLAWKRSENERLMPGFWELPERKDCPEIKTAAEIGQFRHGITFHNYRFLILEAAVPADPGACKWIELSGLQEMAISTIFRKAARIVAKYRKKEEPDQKAAASSG